MSDDQTKTTDEGPFAVYRVGRNAAPVFRESLDEAIQVAKVGAEQSGGEYLILRVLGSVRAEAHWTARVEAREPDRVVAAAEDQLEVVEWPSRTIRENIKAFIASAKKRPDPESERPAEKMGMQVGRWYRIPKR